MLRPSADGPAGAVPLVLLHRFRAAVDWWGPEFLDCLAAGRDVIVFDNVGAGCTDGEPCGTLEGFAQGAVEFIDALGLAQADLQRDGPGRHGQVRSGRRGQPAPVPSRGGRGLRARHE
jgi:pimeloyl-ACP methyl ester carboxylesterase